MPERVKKNIQCSIMLLLCIVLSGLDQLHAQTDSTNPVARSITADKLRMLVQTLSHDSMDGRLTGSEGAGKAAAFIHHYMEAVGLKPMEAFAGYYQLFSMEVNEKNVATYNVIGQLTGKVRPDSAIIFSAHFDHIGNNNYNGKKYRSRYSGRNSKIDQLFNGANDNASGVSAMLALADYYTHHAEPYYTLLFVAFSGEEQGLVGSEKLAAIMPTQHIVRLINLEMLGRPNKKGAFITYDRDNNDLQDILNKNLYNNSPAYGKRFFGLDTYSDQQLFMRSDNFPFARAGVKANTIMATSPQDQFYHHADDEWNTLNYEKMAEIVQAIALACQPIICPQ